MPHSIGFNLVCHFLYPGFWFWSAIFSKLRQKKFISVVGWFQLSPTIPMPFWLSWSQLLCSPTSIWITTVLLGSLLFISSSSGSLQQSMPWNAGIFGDLVASTLPGISWWEMSMVFMSVALTANHPWCTSQLQITPWSLVVNLALKGASRD